MRFINDVQSAKSRDDIIPLLSSPREELEATQSELFKILIDRSKKDSQKYDALREIYQMQTLPYETLELTDNLELFCIKCVLDPKVPIRLKLLYLLVVLNQHKLSSKISPLLQSYLERKFSENDPANIPYLMTLVLAFESKELYQQHIGEFNDLITGKCFTICSTLPVLIDCAQKYPALMKDHQSVHIIEKKFSNWLMKASTVEKGAINIYFTNVQVSELDGSHVNGFFTVLNYTSQYSNSQIVNVYTFSLLHKWLNALNVQSLPGKQENTQTTQTQNRELLETTLTYCIRLLSQSEAALTNTEMKIAFSRLYVESVVLEAVRLLDLACIANPNLVNNVFSVLKRLYELLSKINIQLPQNNPNIYRYLQLSQIHNQVESQTGTIILELLSFFIRNANTKLYDPASVFNSFFTDLFPLHGSVRESMFPIEMILFIINNLKLISETTRLLDDYYPQLFKLVSLMPNPIKKEFNSLLPMMMSKMNFIDLLHRIVDLPVVAYILELDITKNPLSKDPNDYQNTLFESILSDERNSETKFWDTQTNSKDWKKFCDGILHFSINVREVCKCAPLLLETYLEHIALESKTNPELILELIPILFKRVQTLFPLADYLSSMKRIILKYLLKFCLRFPDVLIDLKEILLPTLQESKEDIFMYICYIIGECITKCTDSRLTVSNIIQYFDALEMLAYEKLNIVRGISSQSDQSAETFTVLIGAICKTAAKCPDLIPRAIIYLSNIAKHSKVFHPIVVQCANETIRLLQFPSITTSIFNSKPVKRSSKDLKGLHKTIDNSQEEYTMNSSLPYIFQTKQDFSENL